MPRIGVVGHLPEIHADEVRGVPTSQFVDGTAREPTARDLAVVRLIPAVLGRVDAVRLPKVQPRRAVLRLERRDVLLAFDDGVAEDDGGEHVGILACIGAGIGADAGGVRPRPQACLRARRRRRRA